MTTSTELVVRDQRDIIDGWREAMPQTVQLAEYIAGTEFVPRGLRGKPAAVAAAVLAGREVGIGPMTALQHIHVIEGTPSMSAELKRARVFAAGHEIVVDESTITRCRVRGRRKGSESWSAPVEWTLDDAKRANLAHKDNWKKNPRRMLQARATGELCDLLFPDVVGGLPTTEEVRDDAAEILDDGTPPKRRTAKRSTAVTAPELSAGVPSTSVQAVSPSTSRAAPRATVPEPPLPGEDDVVAADVVATVVDDVRKDDEARETAPGADRDGDEPVRRTQLTKLHTLFTALGVDDRDDRLRDASLIIGHDIMSSTEMTKSEASTLIDTLELAMKQPEPRDYLDTLLHEVATASVMERMRVIDVDIVDPEVRTDDTQEAMS